MLGTWEREAVVSNQEGVFTPFQGETRQCKFISYAGEATEKNAYCL